MSLALPFLVWSGSAVSTRAAVTPASVAAGVVGGVENTGPGESESLSTGGGDAATEVAAQVGIAEVVRTYSVDGGDADGRKQPGAISPLPTGAPWSSPPDDALVVRHNPQAYPALPLPRLWVSNGGAMAERFSGWSRSDRHDCAWGDYNLDGWLDLFCGVGLDTSSTNELWENNGDGSFTDVSASQGFANTDSTHGKYRQATFLDANGDGWPDVYVTRVNSAEGEPFPSPSDSFPNELWINKGVEQGFYLDTSMGLTKMAPAAGGNDGCNTAFDYNGDETHDVIMCGAKNFFLYKNVGNASFTNVSKAAGVGGAWADAEWGDFNGDGLPDLVQVKAASVRIMEQSATGAFKQAWSAPLTGGFNVAVGDLNGDRSLDFYVVATCTGSPSTDRQDKIFYGSSSNLGAPVGGALSFSTQAIPSLGAASKGCGNAVDAIDFDRDGRADFLVLNGRKTSAGPVQLWTNPSVASR